MKKILSISATGQNLLKTASLDNIIGRQHKNIKHYICHIVGSAFRQPPGYYAGIELPYINRQLFIDDSNKVLCTAQTMMDFEEVLRELHPDIVILTGWENMTLACALAASKMKMPLAHIDSGLRSFDPSSDEEINRIVIDVLCQYHFVSEHSGMKNLRDEGMDNQKIYFTGNLLADILNIYWEKIESSKHDIMTELEKSNGYLLFVPSISLSVDDIELIKEIFEIFNRISRNYHIYMILPDKLKEKLENIDALKILGKNISVLPRCNYLDFLSLMYRSRMVITNSSAIQEETTYLGVQCVTVLNYTERPVTIDVGTNHLSGKDTAKAEKIINDILEGMEKPARLPENWDGKAGIRIADILC